MQVTVRILREEFLSWSQFTYSFNEPGAYSELCPSDLLLKALLLRPQDVSDLPGDLVEMQVLISKAGTGFATLHF